MRRALMSTAILATLALVATLLAGVTAGPANAGAGYQKPKVGQCRNLSGAQARAKTNSTKPVSCASTHTAQTVGVGKLSAKLAKSSKQRIKEAEASKCQKLFNKYVGRSAATRAKSAFALRIFNPSKAQKKKGARWFRCDAVLPRGSSLSAIKTTKKPLLSSPTPTSQALCQTSGGSPTTCDVTHSYKATSAFKLKGKKYPGKKQVKKDAKNGCNSRISGSFRYDAPSAADWDVKKRYVVCFDGHTLPPPVVVTSGPATTLSVPPGSVPTGTPVTIEGVATDDVSVASVAVTLRDSGGLYLQDNLTTFSATSNTLPITYPNGALGTASASWRVSLGDSVPTGTHTVAVTVVDSSGLSKVVNDTLVITSAPDTTKPSASLSSPPTSLTTTTNLVISGAANDNVQVANVTVQLRRNSDDTYLQDGLGSFAGSNAGGLPVNPTGIGTSSASFGIDTGTRAAGTYTVEVTSEDAAGNVSNLVTRTVTVSVATGGTEVYYAMNEASGAIQMLDTGSSGLNLVGAINQAGLDTGVAKDSATSYNWLFTSPEAPPAKPERVISVPDNAALDAGSDTFTVEVRYQTVNSFGNVMQKGQSGSTGGQWKIQQPGGYPSCLFKRRTNLEDFQISVQSTVDFSVGSWHTLKCVRSGDNVTMFVDGVYNGQKNFAGVGENGTPGSVGTINNTVPLTIGGKLNCDQVVTTCDYFTGWIDYVKLTHG